MRPPAEQLIRDYLNRLSVAARSRLKPEDRRAFLARTGDFIERQSGVRGTADPAEVMRILAGIGEPENVVERERVRLETQRSERAAAASRVTLWKPRRQGDSKDQGGAAQPTNKDGRPLTGEIRVTSRPITSRWKPGEPLRPRDDQAAQPPPPAGRTGRSGWVSWIPRPRRGGSAPPPPETGPQAPDAQATQRSPAPAPQSPGRPGPASDGGPSPASAGPAGGSGLASSGPASGRWATPAGQDGADPGGLAGAAPGGSGTQAGGVSAGSSGPATAGSGSRTVGDPGSGASPGPVARGGTGSAGSGGPAAAGRDGVSSGGTVGAVPGSRGAPSAGSDGAASSGQGGVPPGSGGAVPAAARNGGSAGLNGTGSVHQLPSATGASSAGPARPVSPQAAGPAAGPLTPERGNAAASPGFTGRTVRIGLPGRTLRIGRVARPARRTGGRATRSAVLPAPRRRLQPGDVTLLIARRAADTGRQHRMEAVCVVMMIIAGLIYPVPLWLVGFLIWLIAAAVTTISTVWSLPDKWIGIVGPVALVIIGTATLVSFGGTLVTFHDYVHEALADSVWLIKIGALLGGAFLVWRLQRGRRAPAVPPWLRRNRR